jgi:hypothetical protein
MIHRTSLLADCGRSSKGDTQMWELEPFPSDHRRRRDPTCCVPLQHLGDKTDGLRNGGFLAHCSPQGAKMRQKSNSTPASAETLVRNIPRATRKHHAGGCARSSRLVLRSRRRAEIEEILVHALAPLSARWASGVSSLPSPAFAASPSAALRRIYGHEVRRSAGALRYDGRRASRDRRSRNGHTSTWS